MAWVSFVNGEMMDFIIKRDGKGRFKLNLGLKFLNHVLNLNLRLKMLVIIIYFKKMTLFSIKINKYYKNIQIFTNAQKNIIYEPKNLWKFNLFHSTTSSYEKIYAGIKTMRSEWNELSWA